MIGYYVHHQGRGHLARASSICAHLHSPVTVLSSTAADGQGRFATVLLARDDVADSATDPTANGTLHWAPLQDSGFRERMRVITAWVAAARPDVMVVDVSVEVAMLVRLMGVPVVAMAMPGDRTDPPHDLVYRTAEHIIAPWAKDLYEPHWLRQHAAKTTYVGGISRFDGRAGTAAPDTGGVHIVVLGSKGGSDVNMSAIDDCASAYPQWEWAAIGIAGAPWLPDPWPALRAADVVVSAAGQSSVADIAAIGRPAIIIAQDRPFAEQQATASTLEGAGLAVVHEGWPALSDWPALVEQALRCDPDGWRRWGTRGAAHRAAIAIEHVATGLAVGSRR